MYVDSKILAVDDYPSLKGYGGKGPTLRTTLQDKGHRAELEAFHRLATGHSQAPISLEEMLEVTELSFTVRDQVRGGDFACLSGGGALVEPA